jgi:PAS domain S-box-containing protein
MVSWVTVVWSMIAGVSLTVAAIHALVWYWNRSAWSHLLFSLTAASTAAYGFCELLLMRAGTPEEVLLALRLAQAPMFIWLVALTWFIKVHLREGRAWLAWTISGLRVLYVIPTIFGINVNYTAITNVRHMQFLGEPVTVIGQGVRNPLTALGHSTVLLVLIFVADASIAAWKRGDRRKAVMIGGSAELFLLAGLGSVVALFWLNVEAPFVVSVFYLGMIAVMGYELSNDVLRASQLVRDLQISQDGLRESEARMSLAVDVADFGIWIRHLPGNNIWASEKWRELYGFTATEHLNFDAILGRLHPDDRDRFKDAQTTAIASEDEGKYQTDYRIVLPDGAIRWISSHSRVELDAARQPILIRSASRDITAQKAGEIAVRNLSGRLLSAQEEERRRIARELHDNLSQQIALLAMQIDALAMTPGMSAATIAHSMHELRTRAADISTEIHNLSHRLHSSKLEMLGLVAALRGHCHELRAQGIHAHLHHDDVPRSLSPDVELCLFRVAQEALNNVVKHSGTHEAHISLNATDDKLVLTIVDSGRGFDERAHATAHNGLGLASMRERLRLIDGEFTIRSKPSKGTSIIVRVPLSKANRRTISESARTA